MKQFGFRFIVALLTFSIGIAVAALYLHEWSYPSPPPIPAREVKKADSPAQTSGRVEVKFLRFINGEGYAPYAEFLVTNATSEPLYYTGYSKRDTCSYKLQAGERVFDGGNCDCGTGLAKRELLPGEQVPITVMLASRRYEFVVTRGSGKFQIGFDFLVGESNREQTVWSDWVAVPEKR
jgi:hypothetical protein